MPDEEQAALVRSTSSERMSIFRASERHLEGMPPTGHHPALIPSALYSLRPQNVSGFCVLDELCFCFFLDEPGRSAAGPRWFVSDVLKTLKSLRLCDIAQSADQSQACDTRTVSSLGYDVRQSTSYTATSSMRRHRCPSF